MPLLSLADLKEPNLAPTVCAFQEAIESRGAKNMQLPGQIKDLDDEDDTQSFTDMKAGGKAVKTALKCASL